MALLLARVLAAGFVGVDGVDAPRELAARLAAEAVAPAGAEEAVAAASGGLGADIVIEAAGLPAALGAALELVRGRGTLSVVEPTSRTRPPSEQRSHVRAEITFRFSIGDPVTNRERLIRLMAASWPVEAGQQALQGALIDLGSNVSARSPSLQQPRALQGTRGCRPIAAVKGKLTHAFKSRTGEIGARWPRLVATRAPLA